MNIIKHGNSVSTYFIINFFETMKIADLFNPGIYQITCLMNGKKYIGESSNVLTRLGRHADSLENNRHDCKDLQTDFNQYGKVGFEFDILNLDSKNESETYRKEKEAIYLAKSHNLYNKTISHEWSPYLQQVQINGKFYPSLRQAALLLNESRTHLTRKCRDIHNPHYRFLTKTPALLKNKSRKCKVHNVSSKSIRQAAIELNKTPREIKKRCGSKNFPDYFFIDSLE